MTTYKLTYFDFDGGRAEPIRIAFHAAGVEFEDERISFADFGKMRGNTRFNSVPVLEIDGTAITQSNAMCRYVGKMAGLYPEDDLQALYCDEALAPSKTFFITRCIPSASKVKNSRVPARSWSTVGYPCICRVSMSC